LKGNIYFIGEEYIFKRVGLKGKKMFYIAIYNFLFTGTFGTGEEARI
jgi:hypothetical protein